MKLKTSALVAALALTPILNPATSALAREPGVGAIMPAGATLGVPVGANPPPGLFFSSRTTLSFGQLKDANGDDAGVDLAVKSTVLQLHYTPGTKLFGGDYRAMVLVPLVQLDQTIGAPFPAFLHGSSDTAGIGDVTISPLNLSWMVEPGVFWTFGTSLSLPTGSFDANGLSLGSNVLGGTVEAGYSYLRDGWNASAHLVYSTQAENKDTRYQSGDELLLNLTAIKDMGGYGLGAVGYWRKQITDDVNRGTNYGGLASGRAEQIALGIGYTRPLAGGELNINLTHDFVAKNTVGGTNLQVNFSIPLGKKG